MVGPPAVGSPIESLTRHLDAVTLVAYAGATWDWNRLHYDSDEVAARGLPGPVVDGQMFGALLAEQVQDHFGPRCRIRSMGFRYAAMVFAGETVTVVGSVEAVHGDPSAGGVVRVVQQIAASGEEGKLAVRDAWCELSLDGWSS